MTYWTLAFIFVSCIAVYALWATHQNTETIKKMMEIIDDMGKLEDEMYATMKKQSALMEKESALMKKLITEANHETDQV